MSAIVQAVNLFEHKNTKKRKRVGRGRGSGLGKTCGKGQKGQKARSGVGGVRAFEGGQTPLYVRLPRRGFNNIFRVEYKVLNFTQIQEYITSGRLTNEITFESLLLAGIARPRDIIKVLAKGECPKGLKIEAHAFSGSAVDSITKAGGSYSVFEGFAEIATEE